MESNATRRSRQSLPDGISGGDDAPQAPLRKGDGERPHVVIVGGGFAGLYCARALKRGPVRVTLLDSRNFHLFQPLLYQVATGGLSPGDIAAPLRAVLQRHKNTRVTLAEVVDFEPSAKKVILRDGRIPYDVLVVAAGTVNTYFGHEEWATHAPGLKSIEDATEIRRRILLAFEFAERTVDANTRRAFMTFVVVGGGPTGVELAGALAEIARHTLRGEFRDLDPSDARIVLIEGADRVLPSFVPALSEQARRSLDGLGIEVHTGRLVRGIDEHGVTVTAKGTDERIEARTVLWAAGVRPSPLVWPLAQRTAARADGSGRIVVEPDLSIAGYPDIFVIGDMAYVEDRHGNPLPALAPVAMQEGRYVARTIAARARGRTVAPFRYRDRGTLATIGRSKAVADLGCMRLSGFVAWVLWLFVHLLYLVEFQNRVLVLMQWGWSYITWDRSARLITGADKLPDLPGAAPRGTTTSKGASSSQTDT